MSFDNILFIWGLAIVVDKRSLTNFSLELPPGCFHFGALVWELALAISGLGPWAGELWPWLLGLGSLAWGLWLGKSNQVNGFAAAGGIGLGVSQPLPPRRLNKNPPGRLVRGLLK